MLALLVAAIFPTGGEVPPNPTIWISADEVPAISVRTADGPVLFQVDEMKVEHGIHRIAIYPQLDIGSKFTVTAGKVHQSFTVVDGDRHGAAADQPDVDVEFKRLSVVHRGNADVLVVDAVCRRGTIMYLLNQEHFDGVHDPGYLWIGEGSSAHRDSTYDPAGSLEQTHFEIPLAEFGVSCASQATVSFSPYTQGISSGATLYPIATLAVDHGKIKLPMTMLGDFDHATAALPWLPCPGAAADALPPAPEHPSVEPAPAPIADPPAIAAPDPAPPVEATDSASIWLATVIVLLGGLLVMWRATSRTGA
jgi:hypothetical protein